MFTYAWNGRIYYFLKGQPFWILIRELPVDYACNTPKNYIRALPPHDATFLQVMYNFPIFCVEIGRLVWDFVACLRDRCSGVVVPAGLMRTLVRCELWVWNFHQSTGCCKELSNWNRPINNVACMQGTCKRSLWLWLCGSWPALGAKDPLNSGCGRVKPKMRAPQLSMCIYNS